MADTNSPIAIIPSECFRWRARVQFIESFRTQAAALNFAFQHGYNLIVERDEGSVPIFDVLLDPDGTCTAGLNLELLKTEDVLLEPANVGWTALLLWTVWDLAKRLAGLSAALFVRQVIPPSRRTAAALKLRAQEAIPASERAGAQADSRLQEIAPLYRRTAEIARGRFNEIAINIKISAHRCWWSGSALAFRRAWHRNSHGSIADLAKRSAALGSLYLREIRPLCRRAAIAVAHAYANEIAPRCRSFASRCWWSDSSIAFRRVWHRHSQGTIGDLARRSAALGSLHLREVHPLYVRMSAVAKMYLRDITPLSRRVAAVIHSHLLQAGRLCRRTAAFASLYFRETAPILRSAAVRCWSDSKSVTRRHSWAVVTVHDPARSHLRSSRI